MMKEERARRELEAQRCMLYHEIQRMVTVLDVHSLERLCRKVHIIELKINAFKGGIYDKE